MITGADHARHTVFHALSADRRRETLAALLGRDSAVTEDDLREYLASTERHREIGMGSIDRNPIRSDLRHVHLPLLAGADLVAWDRTAGTVTTGPHPAYGDPRFRLLLEVDADGVDETLSMLSDPRCQTVLTILRDRAEVTVSELAAEIRHSEFATPGSEVWAGEDVPVLLYHHILPKLASAGHVDYDEISETVSLGEHPALQRVLAVIFDPPHQLTTSSSGFMNGLEGAFRRSEAATLASETTPAIWVDYTHG